MKLSNFNFLKLFVAISAFADASVAAIFSVYGIGQVFAGAMMFAIVMAIAIEISKIVAVSYIYRKWKTIGLGLKTFFVSAVIIAMIVTSMGVFGFLSNAYEGTAVVHRENIAVVELKSKKIEMFKNEITSLNTDRETKTDRITQLTDIRSKQETRLDTLYNRSTWASFQQAKNVETSIKKADEEITKLSTDIQTLNSRIVNLNDSINRLNLESVELSNNEATRDLGPLMYVARVLGWEMDRAILMLILMLVVILDPMAIALLIAFNKLTLEKDKLEIKPSETVALDRQNVGKSTFYREKKKKRPQLKKLDNKQEISTNTYNDIDKAIDVFKDDYDKRPIIDSIDPKVETETKEVIEPIFNKEENKYNSVTEKDIRKQTGQDIRIVTHRNR